ncbi:geranylgeranyl reductase family protein [uncultured Methanolobus sp.]|uniref:geranylgeranyl reductase family protein n=1 Tax=uncultured Methanolobus sp. TaxID=218300 RepID=UPI0029C8C95D|nr:geranylgeranyl reductase family protein [uncultured Methanolobus sp.]
MYDLIIIGAGPSGSSAGRIAGKNGLKTLIIEKEMFPRYKPCGGALSEHAMSYLDFKIPEDIIEKDIFGGRVRFRGKSIEYFKDYRLSAIVTRSIFDNYLLEKAKETGIDIHHEEKVTDISQNDAHVSVTTNKDSYKARYVVIATGSQGKLKTVVRREENKSEYGVCLVTEVEEKDEVIDQYIKDAIEMHFGVSGVGYGWVFPHKGYYSVGAGSVMAKHLPNPKMAMQDYLKVNGFTGKYKLNSHVIPCGGHKRKLVKGRIILSGDAAGFVDAFTGEGLAYAIRSGQLAAETIALNAGTELKLQELLNYENRCYSEFGEHLKYSLIFAKIMHYFPERSFNAFIKETDILDMFLEVVTFNRTYKDLVKWLMFNFKFHWLKK